jgi:hypothetical protein
MPHRPYVWPFSWRQQIGLFDRVPQEWFGLGNPILLQIGLRKIGLREDRGLTQLPVSQPLDLKNAREQALRLGVLPKFDQGKG